MSRESDWGQESHSRKHDRECESRLLLSHFSALGWSLSLEEKKTLVSIFCLCSQRALHVGFKPKASQINRLTRRAEVWVLISRGKYGKKTLREQLKMTDQVVDDKQSLWSVGVELPHRVIEIDFRNRARIHR